jgi:hypothetical protein
MKSLRDSMPETAAFIDACREVFGAEMINAQIKLGMQGAETFYAAENSIEVGTKFHESTKFITTDRMVINPTKKLTKWKNNAR